MTKHQEAAEKFDHANPEVWSLFRSYTIEALRRGRRKIGSKMVWERIRWYTAVETNEESPKLNNNYTAYYARKFQQQYPGWAHIFNTRESGQVEL